MRACWRFSSAMECMTILHRVELSRRHFQPIDGHESSTRSLGLKRRKILQEPVDSLIDRLGDIVSREQVVLSGSQINLLYDFVAVRCDSPHLHCPDEFPPNGPIRVILVYSERTTRYLSKSNSIIIIQNLL